jgi:hypothetical protein
MVKVRYIQKICASPICDPLEKIRIYPVKVCKPQNIKLNSWKYVLSTIQKPGDDRLRSTHIRGQAFLKEVFWAFASYFVQLYLADIVFIYF